MAPWSRASMSKENLVSRARQSSVQRSERPSGITELQRIDPFNRYDVMGISENSESHPHPLFQSLQSGFSRTMPEFF